MSLITVLNDLGSGGKVITQKVAEELGLELYDNERLMEKAVEMGFEEKYTLGLREKSPGFFDRLMGKNPEIYLDVLQAVVYEIARQGTGLIFGHGSQILLKDFSCALHVRIIASEEKRIENVVARRSVDEADARQIMKQKDDEFKRFFSYAFNMEFNDISLYDLVINTDKIGFDQAAKQIISLAQSSEIKACSLNALDVMKRRSLERVVHAEMARQEIDTRAINLSIEEGNVANIKGIVRTEGERLRTIDTVKSMKEVADIKENLIVISNLSA